MRHRITIQQQTVTRDSYGGETVTWSTFAVVYAAVEPIKGQEFFESAKVNAETSHRIRIRHYPGIAPKMQVSWDSRIFRIEAVLNIDERDRELHLICREVA